MCSWLNKKEKNSFSFYFEKIYFTKTKKYIKLAPKIFYFYNLKKLKWVQITL